jgi:hypothetical protein
VIYLKRCPQVRQDLGIKMTGNDQITPHITTDLERPYHRADKPDTNKSHAMTCAGDPGVNILFFG